MHFTDDGSGRFSYSIKRRFISLLPLLLLLMVAFIQPGTIKAATITVGPALTVDVSADRHPISRDIYGMNYADAALAKELKLPVSRWGGNANSRYNWQVDSSNSGSDWYFVGGKGGAPVVPGASVDNSVTTYQSTGTQSMLTMPMLPYINATADKNCSYPSNLYPDQQAFEPYPGPNGAVCGNGKDLNGNSILDTNILLNNVPNSPAYQQQWVQHLVSTHGTASQGGVQFFDLDNEPSLWQYTHHDVHPAGTGYDELVNLSTSYATMIKSVDSGIRVLGPSDWGYPAYTTGIGATGDDAQSHGGIGFGEYYLQQMHAYEQQHGVRLLDYFDEHFYPQGSGVTGSAGDAATQALRLRSTRSLWDPTYVDESWIGTYAPPIQLIPTFRSWINKDYPGTKLAISEYNWGGLESINGALAEADVLGIFGREGVDLATMWAPPAATQPGAYAFRMYLNYDGQGSSYGDTWVHSTSSDQGQLAIYGAQRSSDGTLTLMVINKTATDLTSNLALAGAAPAGNAQVYTYSDANLGAIVRQPDLAVSNSGFSTTYAANSMTLVVIPPTSFRVSYEVRGQSQKNHTFTANLELTNAGKTLVNGWTLQFAFPGNQVITHLSNANFTQRGNLVTITNKSPHVIHPHDSVTFSLKGTFSGDNAAPTGFTVDGIPVSVTG